MKYKFTKASFSIKILLYCLKILRQKYMNILRELDYSYINKPIL